MAWITKASIILLFVVSLGLAADMALTWYMRFKQWRHRRAADRRIVAQAKAAEVWDKRPIVLGGRALELKAWEDFKIKRQPGEPDAHLRRRCMTAADNELANSPTTKEKRHDEIDARLYAYGEFERRQQNKGEG